MTRLGEALRGMADGYPALSPPPEGMFDRARRAQTRRRLATGFAVVFILAALGYTTWLLPPAAPVAAGAPNIPTYFIDPPKWTADVRAAPIERALMAFVMSSDHGKLVIVGPDSAYRTYRIPVAGASEWTPSFLLAPDGRSLMVVRQKTTELLDLASGRVSTLEAGAPVAWSPDGSQAILASFDDAQLRVVRMPSGEVVWRIPLRRDETRVAAAFSPDGAQVAVQQGATLSVQRPGGEKWSKSVVERLSLAGPLAWTEDGSRIALARLTPTTVFDLLDAATGQDVGTISNTGGLNYIGEQGRSVGLPAVVGWLEGSPIVNAGNRSVLHLNVPHNTLMIAVDGTREFQLSSVGTDWDAIDPRPPDPGPALQRYRPLVTPALAALITVLGLIFAAVWYFRPLRWLRRSTR
jgi:hypothetical protein